MRENHMQVTLGVFWVTISLTAFNILSCCPLLKVLYLGSIRNDNCITGPDASGVEGSGYFSSIYVCQPIYKNIFVLIYYIYWKGGVGEKEKKELRARLSVTEEMIIPFNEMGKNRKAEGVIFRDLIRTWQVWDAYWIYR